MRLAVLSDSHINRSAAPWTWDLARAAFSSASRADHVIVAGDLFDSSGAMLRDRGVVERCLRRLGLWHADRLTVVPGNHDFFHLSHHSRAECALYRYANIAYREFCGWIAELVPRNARASPKSLFPFCKDLGLATLLGADTTSFHFLGSKNGYWRPEENRAARRLLSSASAPVRVLAIHHPPVENEGVLDFGFPAGDFRRLKRFVDDVSIDVVVCGHIHDNSGAPWSWDVGQRARAHMVGRTGGVHDATPVIGVLDVGKRGGIKWSTERV